LIISCKYSFPATVIFFLRELSDSTFFVSKIPPVAQITQISCFIGICFIFPMPGAPGLILISKPPKNEEITSPKPVRFFTSAIWAI